MPFLSANLIPLLGQWGIHTFFGMLSYHQFPRKSTKICGFFILNVDFFPEGL